MLVIMAAARAARAGRSRSGLAVDRNHRIHVGDRKNSPIQVFTDDGDFIEEWPDIYDPVNHIASYDGGWVNKFIPKPGADPSKVLGKRLLLH